MSCETCKFPSLAQQAKNVGLSVFNVMTQAYKTGKVLASEEKVKGRISKCESCEFLNNNRCNQCGCFIALKAGLESESCPKGKWNGLD